VALDLMTLLGFLLRSSGQRFYALVEELDLSITQIKTLHVLESLVDELSVNELAKLLGLSLPAASRNIEGLLRRGYVERREDDHDRRVKRVRLSESGGEVAMELHSQRLAELEDLAATFSDRQRRQLRDALASLLEREDIAACRPHIPSPR
jgi:DNA-binding MarR family transcriptional regulator